MKKAAIFIFLNLFLVSFIVSCKNPIDTGSAQRGRYETDPVSGAKTYYEPYDDPEMEGFFDPKPDDKKLLNEEEFIKKVSESPYIQDLDIIPLDEMIKLVGLPQREFNFSLVGASTAHSPRIRYFEWDLKDNKTIDYYVVLSDDCDDEKANPENLMSYGAVLGATKRKLTEEDGKKLGAVPGQDVPIEIHLNRDTAK